MYQSKLSNTDSISSGNATIKYKMKYKKNNYKALIGKRLNDNMAVELQYVDFAKKNSGSVAVNEVPFTLNFSGNSLGVAGLYYFNPQGDFSPFVKLGIHSWNSKNKVGGKSVKDDGTDVLYAVGVDGKINETMKYRVEFERLKADSDYMNNIGVALLVGF
ncbi:hypothetical protein BHECKSOX2_1370 [Bathymodiolus heckerae thiotrophic gill symbiont]|nr:hypothetical protein BHECKSOX2_1370 [Bathymodiolus heckerae thiotrophic gill symbiont]